MDDLAQPSEPVAKLLAQLARAGLPFAVPAPVPLPDGSTVAGTSGGRPPCARLALSRNEAGDDGGGGAAGGEVCDAGHHR